MILAAGRGERMGELTQHVPKPLLKVNGFYLIEYSIAALKRAGITEIVMNISYLADQIKSTLGNGNQFGVDIVYSEEKERLETGGGILQALPLLGPDPFIVKACDIISEYHLTWLPKKLKGLAHLVLTDNPSFHPQGDFGLFGNQVSLQAKPFYNYGGFGVFHPDLFANEKPGRFPLSKLLLPAIEAKEVTGEYYDGAWFNIGTPDELAFACKWQSSKLA